MEKRMRKLTTRETSELIYGGHITPTQQLMIEKNLNTCKQYMGIENSDLPVPMTMKYDDGLKINRAYNKAVRILRKLADDDIDLYAFRLDEAAEYEQREYGKVVDLYNEIMKNY